MSNLSASTARYEFIIYDNEVGTEMGWTWVKIVGRIKRLRKLLLLNCGYWIANTSKIL